MPLDTATTIALGSVLFILGRRLGRSLLQRGATANDLFKGRNPLSLAFLGCYVCFMIAILNIPQMTFFPLEWRFYGMQITWGLMHLTLAVLCGMSITISWHTARSQVITVALIGIVGVATFSGFESFLLSPIHAQLHDDLQPNGVFRQTSNSSCAPAAMATVLRQWGLPMTESWVAELAGTSRMGTSMPQLIVAAQALNLDGVELKPTWELMQQINRPGILSVWLVSDYGKKLPHAVALLGLTDTAATIADPAKGEILTFSRADLADIWRQQYVPIIRPSDRTMSSTEASTHLKELGYLDSGRRMQGVQSSIKAFQVDHQLSPTGTLDAETALALSGPFLKDAPRLDHFQE